MPFSSGALTYHAPRAHNGTVALAARTRCRITVRCNGLLCRRLLIGVPPWKHQHCGMALESTSKNLRALHTKANAIVLDGGNRGLRNARKLSQLILAEFLKFANDAHRFTDTDLGAAFGWTELTHFLWSPIIVCSDRHNLEYLLCSHNPVDNAILDGQARGSMAFPLSGKRFVMEPLDRT
ncbi:MAG TPA: hypothetical protein VGA88_05345 [Burkholderiales bacterium]